MTRPLRVAILGKRYPDSFAVCIAEAFGELGHSVKLVDDDRFFTTAPIPRVRMAWRKLLEQVPRLHDMATRAVVREVLGFRPDLVVSVSKTLPPSVIEAVKTGSDARTAFWFPDAISNLGRQLFLASPFDVFCFKDRFLVDVMRRRIGLTAHFLPDAARNVSLDGATVESKCEILIACNLYPYRIRLLEALQEFDLRIYGIKPAWVTSPILRFHQGTYLSGAAKTHAYQSAAIVLNNNHFAEIQGINARTFEVCGSGAFLLTDHHPSLAEYYDPETEVGVFEGVSDIGEKARFFLARPALREAMARRAHRRTLDEHRYVHRIQKLIDLAGLQG